MASLKALDQGKYDHPTENRRLRVNEMPTMLLLDLYEDAQIPDINVLQKVFPFFNTSCIRAMTDTGLQCFLDITAAELDYTITKAKEKQQPPRNVGATTFTRRSLPLFGSRLENAGSTLENAKGGRRRTSSRRRQLRKTRGSRRSSGRRSSGRRSSR